MRVEVNEPNTPSIDRWNSHDRDGRKSTGMIISLILAILLHVVLFIFLKKIEFFSQAKSSNEIVLDDVIMDQVVLKEAPEVVPEATPQTVPDITEQEQVSELEDVLDDMKNQEIDIKTDIEAPELSIKMSMPAQMGELDGVLDDVLISASAITPLESIGSGVNSNDLAAEGQVVIDEGSIKGELLDADKILDNSALKGVGGFSNDGVMKGYSSLDELASMSSINLQGARSALPSDMLYDYDSAELKSVAKFGLNKLILLIDSNPDMYCILEGHTDTFGPESYNQQLSTARAQAVKDYLVGLLGSGKQIIVRGFGKSRPLLAEGTVEEQAPNRRVDIMMRREIPPVAAYTAPKTSPAPVPKPAPVVQEQPRAVLVEEEPKPVIEVAPEPEQPVRAIIVEDDVPAAVVVEATPPATRPPIVVKPLRNPNIQRAIIVEDENIQRAIIVD